MTPTTYHGGPRDGETKELVDTFIAGIRDVGIGKNVVRYFYVRSLDNQDMYLAWTGSIEEWNRLGIPDLLLKERRKQ